MVGLVLGVVCCLGQSSVWAQPATLVSSAKSVPKLPLWGQFRGDAFGHAMASGLPSKFGPENIRWKTRLPGRGASTPIVVGDRVFLTAYSGFGLSADAPGKPSDLRHHVICLDAATGALIWQQTIRGNEAISPRVSQNLAMHGFASSTPVSDGQRVFAFFGVSGVFAFDINGKYLWQQDVGWRDDNFGSSASLLVDGQRLIVNASVESDTVESYVCGPAPLMDDAMRMVPQRTVAASARRSSSESSPWRCIQLRSASRMIRRTTNRR